LVSSVVGGALATALVVENKETEMRKSSEPAQEEKFLLGY